MKRPALDKFMSDGDGRVAQGFTIGLMTYSNSAIIELPAEFFNLHYRHHIAYTIRTIRSF